MASSRPKQFATIDTFSKRRFDLSILGKMEKIDPLLQRLRDNKILYMYSSLRSPNTLEEVTSKAIPSFFLNPVDRPNSIKKLSHQKTLSLDSGFSCFIDPLNPQDESDSEEDLIGKLETLIEYPSLAEEHFESNRSFRTKCLEPILNDISFKYPSTCGKDTFSKQPQTISTKFSTVPCFSQTDEKLGPELLLPKTDMFFRNSACKLTDLPNGLSNNLLKDSNNNELALSKLEKSHATFSSKESEIIPDENSSLLISSKDSVGSSNKTGQGFFSGKKSFKDPASNFKDQNIKKWAKKRFSSSFKTTGENYTKNINKSDVVTNETVSQQALAFSTNGFKQIDLIPHHAQTTKKVNVKMDLPSNRETSSIFKIHDQSINTPFSCFDWISSVNNSNNHISTKETNCKKIYNNNMYMSEPFAYDQSKPSKSQLSPKQDLHVTFRNSFSSSFPRFSKQSASNFVPLPSCTPVNQPFIIKLSKPSEFFPGIYNTAPEVDNTPDYKYQTSLSPETSVSKPINLLRSFSRLRARDKGIYVKHPIALSNLNQITI